MKILLYPGFYYRSPARKAWWGRTAGDLITINKAYAIKHYELYQKILTAKKEKQ